MMMVVVVVVVINHAIITYDINMNTLSQLMIESYNNKANNSNRTNFREPLCIYYKRFAFRLLLSSKIKLSSEIKKIL